MGRRGEGGGWREERTGVMYKGRWVRDEGGEVREEM